MKLYKLLLIMPVFGAIFVSSCQSPSQEDSKKKTTSIVNPNGDSELALLMREMFDDCMRVKEDAALGKRTTFTFDPKAIFTAHATEPEKAASEIYKQMGIAYLNASDAFEAAPLHEKKDRFTGIVTTCIACHQKLCPGPIRKINKLLYED